MDFQRLIRKAEQSELLTAEEAAARDAERARADEAARDRSEEQATRELQDIWDAVSQAMVDNNPPADLEIVDIERMGELPYRGVDTDGWRARRRIARWNAAADRLAIPAWDMIATLQEAGGIADTYSIDSYPMYLGANDVIYVGPRGQTPTGTYTEWQTSARSAKEVRGTWHPEWGISSIRINSREEVAVGLANLVVKHGLPGFSS